MGCMAILAIPSAGLSFFTCAWVMMIFWGMMADRVGVNTLNYTGAMIVTIGLWIAVAPLIAAIGRTVARGWWWRL